MKRFSPPILVLLVTSFSVEASLDDAASYAVPGNDTINIVPIDTKPFFMPPGCVCKKSGGINDKQCDQFDCVCKCDVTAGVCDLNCCCDEECDSHSFGKCLDEGSISPTVKMCIEGSSALEDINLQYPFRVSDSPEVSLLVSYVLILRIRRVSLWCSGFKGSTSWINMHRKGQQSRERSLLRRSGISPRN